MRRRRDLGPPMTMGAFLRGFALLVVLISTLVALAWAAMSWSVGNRSPALLVVLTLPVAIILLRALGRSMPGWRE